MSRECICGYPGYSYEKQIHPCHGNAFTCKQPAFPRIRYYKRHTIGFVPDKTLDCMETWACDACWAIYQSKL